MSARALWSIHLGHWEVPSRGKRSDLVDDVGHEESARRWLVGCALFRIATILVSAFMFFISVSWQPFGSLQATRHCSLIFQYSLTGPIYLVNVGQSVLCTVIYSTFRSVHWTCLVIRPERAAVYDVIEQTCWRATSTVCLMNVTG